MPRFCTRCGAALTEQDQFCARCGCAQRGSAQPALVSGSAQVAVLPPTNAQPPQQSDRRTQAAPPSAQVNPQPATSGRTRLHPLMGVALRALCLAVGLDIFSMFLSLVQDINNNIGLNKWSYFDTPRQLQDNATRAGGLGLVWGMLLGGIGGMIKLKKDARKERQ